MSDPSPQAPWASRGALKLRHALETFGLNVHGLVCADFGASTGGFTDCLLRAGAARVYAVDTAAGVLAWRLRRDPRVVPLEGINVLHAPPPSDPPGRPVLMDLVVVDLGWTPQRLAVPAALRWLAPAGHIISLIKPQYELEPAEQSRLRRGVLAPDQAEDIAQRVIASLPALGARVRGVTRSPLTGGASRKVRGNIEWFVWLSHA